MTTSATTYSAVLSNGILTSYVPLTTTGDSFSAACSSAIYMPPETEDLAAFDPWFGQHVVPSLSDCLLPQQTSWWDQTAAPSTTFLLGPFVCPNGYTTATTSTLNSLSTLIACCPSGYTYQNAIYSAPTPSQCLSMLTAGQVVTYQGLSSNTWTPNSTTIGSGGYSLPGGQMNGFIFNEAVTTSSSSSSSSSVTAAGTTSGPTATQASQTLSTSSASSTSTSIPTPSGSSGLSSGAKIGLGVGISLGIIGIACLAAVYGMSRRRRKNSASELDGGGPQSMEYGQVLGRPRPDADASHSTSPTFVADMAKHDNIPMSEMDAPNYVHEVHAQNDPVEMG